VLETSEDDERAKAEGVLTLAINALRDIAENRRMASGTAVTEEVAALHRAAAAKLETLHRFISASGDPPRKRLSTKVKAAH